MKYLEKKYGPEASTYMNTYCSMKAGLKNCDSNGGSGPIKCHKAQTRVDDYFKGLRTAYPDDWEQHPFDENVVYSAGGTPHGRLIIANGAIKKARVVAAYKADNARSSNSMSYSDALRRNENLERNNQISMQNNLTLIQQNTILSHVKDLYGKLGYEIPETIIQLQAQQVQIMQSCQEQVSQSPHVEQNATEAEPEDVNSDHSHEST